MRDEPNSANEKVGRLYIVGTPIGNLEDITLRALKVLKEVDFIACEDTRQTQKLLNHYAIRTKLISYHEHNEMTRAPEIIISLEEGAKVALVSDAGTPGISDPGYRLVSLAVRHGIPIVPVPGASAFVAALVASGLPTDDFRFMGFLPPKRNARRKALEEAKKVEQTLIFYEAPQRLMDTLWDIQRLLGADRFVVVAREVTKIHEEFVRGPVDEVFERLKGREIRGEITLLIGLPAVRRTTPRPSTAKEISVRRRVQQLMDEGKLDRKAAMKAAARELDVSKSEIYRRYQAEKS